MKVESVKLILDACQEAGQLQRLQPALPEGITPRCVRVIEQLFLREQQGAPVRVSDISEMLDVTRPGITAVLSCLNRAGYVEKRRDAQDSRTVYVSLTAKGKALYRRYVRDYHQRLTEILAPIGDEGAQELSRLVRLACRLVSEDAAS